MDNVIATEDIVVRGVIYKAGDKVAKEHAEELVEGGFGKKLGKLASEPTTTSEVKSLDTMSAAELKAKAEEMGLAIDGTKAVLIERIKAEALRLAEDGDGESDEE